MTDQQLRRWIRLGPVLVAVLLISAAAAVGLSRTEAQGGLTAATASPTVDGDNADWAGVQGVNITLEQFEIPAGTDWEFNGQVDPKNGTLKVATDDNNIYVLLEVQDTFDYVADDHKMSPAVGIMFQIDGAAGPHMGADDPDYEAGLGMVDIWHWELDCAIGAVSGGGDAGSGDDPDCNLDDEYATDPETREDDDQAGAENSISGSFSHADGTWIFEFSRPLNTGDSTDAQFAAGGTAKVAVAFWDPKESAAGWSDAGHLVSSEGGWINVSLPGAASGGGEPSAPPTGTGLAESASSDSNGSYLWIAGLALVVLAGGGALVVAGMRRRS
ncbi:MAG: ethylbenzene dehydrogenase-related protein [Dehalococcoidia bacterium]